MDEPTTNELNAEFERHAQFARAYHARVRAFNILHPTPYVQVCDADRLSRRITNLAKRIMLAKEEGVV